jgi:hypothetical protein
VSRAFRHITGYGLVGLMVLREQINWATLGLACLVILVFDLPGVRWLKAKAYALATHWIGHDPH